MRLPDEVTIVEVGPRDGLQNEQAIVPVEGGQARQVLSLIEALDDLDDVQAVHSNFDVPDEVLAEVTG
jgi:isopropylmalate/homocitrate/citramalate synthase